jgi:hypothetical protein
MPKGVKGFVKGQSGNLQGKPKGIVSAKTRQWEELGAKIVGESAERFMNALDQLSDEDFMKHYLMILEYFKPKQQRTEMTGKQDFSITWVENKPADYDPDKTDIA